MAKEVFSDISIQALRAGDRLEFAKLVDVASVPIYRLAYKMLGNTQDAEDVLQTTFLKAFQHLGEFEGRSSPSTWLYRIAANEALMMLRKQRPELPIVEDDGQDSQDIEYPTIQLTDWSALPENVLLSTEARANLDKAILHLPELLRIVFILRDIEGLSILETGEALNLSESAVKTRLLRARLRLRDELSLYYDERLRKRNKKNE